MKNISTLRASFRDAKAMLRPLANKEMLCYGLAASAGMVFVHQGVTHIQTIPGMMSYAVGTFNVLFGGMACALGAFGVAVVAREGWKQALEEKRHPPKKEALVYVLPDEITSPPLPRAPAPLPPDHKGAAILTFPQKKRAQGGGGPSPGNAA